LKTQPVISSQDVSYEPILRVCHNCLTSIKKSKVPKLLVSNGLRLDQVPPELELTNLEHQLMARSLLFMKVKKLLISGMKAMVDKVTTVPIEENTVSNTTSMLP